VFVVSVGAGWQPQFDYWWWQRGRSNVGDSPATGDDRELFRTFPFLRVWIFMLHKFFLFFFLFFFYHLLMKYSCS